MFISRRALAGASLVLLSGIILSCNSGGTDSLSNNDGPLVVLEPGANLSAVPAAIIIEPNGPRDPVTQKLTGSTNLAALVLDAGLKPVPGIAVVFTSTAGTLASAGQPVTTDPTGLAPDKLTAAEDAPGPITVTATSANGIKTLVVPIDLAPVAHAGDDQTAECPGPVTLDGSASTDANSTAGTSDDITSYQWFLGTTLITEGKVVHVNLPVGTQVVTLKVTDKAGATGTDELTVTLVDTKPPVVTLRMSPDQLWPPNHKMHSVQAILDIKDCDPAPRVELLSVTSNEPENGLGDGDTAPDISGASLGTDDRVVQVRSERSGPGSGRIYTFVYRVTDASGNATEATATVTVPHDQGH